MTAGDRSRCPRCGVERQPLGSAEHCPACLLTAVLSEAGEPCPYQLLAPMDEDIRGTTYLAQSLLSPPGYVALKVYAPRDGVDEVIARYRVRRPALEQLDHPSIARVLDVGITADGTLYVATRFVAGRLLSAPAVGAALDAAGRATIADQLTGALAAAHALGLAHLKLDASKITISATPALRATIRGVGIALIVEGAAGQPDLDRHALASILAAL